MSFMSCWCPWHSTINTPRPSTRTFKHLTILVAVTGPAAMMPPSTTHHQQHRHPKWSSKATHSPTHHLSTMTPLPASHHDLAIQWPWPETSTPQTATAVFSKLYEVVMRSCATSINNHIQTYYLNIVTTNHSTAFHPPLQTFPAPTTTQTPKNFSTAPPTTPTKLLP